jgi:hypothetical protein
VGGRKQVAGGQAVGLGGAAAVTDLGSGWGLCVGE